MPCAWVANAGEEVSLTSQSVIISYIHFLLWAIDFMHI